MKLLLFNIKALEILTGTKVRMALENCGIEYKWAMDPTNSIINAVGIKIDISHEATVKKIFKDCFVDDEAAVAFKLRCKI